MVDAIGLKHCAVPISGDTRVAHTVYERASGQEYRFVPQGPEVHDGEWQACLRELEAMDCDYLVASGSLPQGLPAAVYAQVARMAADKGARLVLDTSGEPLRRALEAGVYLVKPNLRELETAIGRALRKPAEQDEAARQLIRRGRAQIVTVSLGADGALLATGEGCFRLRAPRMTPRSAVGAGDSFVGAMTLGLAEGRPPRDAFALAVAAGTAAVLTMGTELCRREDVLHIYRQIRAEQVEAAAPQ
jgi:6-phosphofructokinase 2